MSGAQRFFGSLHSASVSGQLGETARFATWKRIGWVKRHGSPRRWVIPDGVLLLFGVASAIAGHLYGEGMLLHGASPFEGTMFSV